MKFFNLVLVLLPLATISSSPSEQKHLPVAQNIKSAPLNTGNAKLDEYLKNSISNLSKLDKLELDPSKYIDKIKSTVEAIPNDLPQRLEGLNTQFNALVGMDIEEANEQSKKLVKRYKRYVTIYKKRSPDSQIDYTQAAKRALAETAAEYKAKRMMKTFVKQLMD